MEYFFLVLNCFSFFLAALRLCRCWIEPGWGRVTVMQLLNFMSSLVFWRRIIFLYLGWWMEHCSTLLISFRIFHLFVSWFEYFGLSALIYMDMSNVSSRYLWLCWLLFWLNPPPPPPSSCDSSFHIMVLNKNTRIVWKKVLWWIFCLKRVPRSDYRK